LQDDFHLENYDYGEDDEWDEDESTWTAEAEAADEQLPEVKDESNAYLEFLNDEVRSLFGLAL
jgi:hypothetical protein